MEGKNDILKNYTFDIRDFSDSQIEVLRLACKSKYNNRELRGKLKSAMKHQEIQKLSYFKKVQNVRRQAYYKQLNSKIRAKLGISESVSVWYGTCKVWIKDLGNKFSRSVFSDYTKDSLKWPEVDIGEESIQAPHVIAGMPSHCVTLTGWERLKQSFFPQKHIEHFNEDDPSQVFNKKTFVDSTLWVTLIIGTVQGSIHAYGALEQYKNNEAGELYESRYWAHRARQEVFIRSFGRYSYRWGWRAGFIYALYYGISQSLAIYRMEDRASHYILAGGVAGALYNWTAGPIGMLKFGLVGLIMLGLPVGFLCGSLGYSLRPILYHSTVDAKVSSPFNASNWAAQKTLMSENLIVAILELLAKPCSLEINNSEFFRSFAGKT